MKFCLMMYKTLPKQEVVSDDSGLSPMVWVSSLVVLSILSIVLWYFLGQI